MSYNSNVLCQKFELDNILENKEISTNGVNEGYGYLFAMKTLAASFKLSLRQVEQIFFCPLLFHLLSRGINYYHKILRTQTILILKSVRRIFYAE
jgi:hypothetical protein